MTSENFADSDTFASAARLHSATCFLNSLLREWNGFQIISSAEGKSVLIPLNNETPHSEKLQLEGLRNEPQHHENPKTNNLKNKKSPDEKSILIPLLRFSCLGNHQYVGKYFLQTKEDLSEISFHSTVEILSDSLAKIFATTPNQLSAFKARVFASQNVIERTLRLRKDELEKLQNSNVSFSEAEQGLFVGHSFHPTPKSRDEFTDHDLQLYSPEFGGRFHLEWYAARPSILRQKSSFSFPNKKWTTDLALADLQKNTTVTTALQEALADGYIPVPMHPWQMKVLSQNPTVKKYLDEKKLIPLGTSSRTVNESTGDTVVETINTPTSSATHKTMTETVNTIWQPTSSLRSIYCAEASYMLKFSMTVKLTNSIRHLFIHEVERGLQLRDVLATAKGEKFQQEHPYFHVVNESAYFCFVDEAQSPLEESIVVCRDNPFSKSKAPGKAVLATLTQNAPFTRDNKIQKMILARSGSEHPLKAARDWFQAYLQVAVVPLIQAQANYGIILGAHQQNLVLDIQNHLPSAAYFRDCQGTGYSELGFKNFSHEVESINRANGNVVSAKMGNYLFAYYLILNSTFNVISAICGQDWISERVLLADLKETLLQIKARGVADSSLLDYLLLEDKIMHKGNFICAFRSLNENTTADPLVIYTHVANPLKGNLNHDT